MITLCLTGIWGMKKNTTVWGAVIRVNDVIVPHDIPAVAVEINKSSELITEKLSRVFYTVYTDTDTLHIPVFWDVSSVNMKLAGVYTMKGVLKLPPEYAFDESKSLQVQTTVSVQYPDKPDINIYYRLTAAGIYIFPWLKQENFDSMEAYLKKESGQWINLTEEGFALCEEEGLYVSNQSMVVGNTYSLLVTYDNGKKQTNTLRFQYQKDGSLKIYGYQHSLLGNTQKPGKIICSYDTRDEKYLSRCGAYAVKIGGNLKQIEKELNRQAVLFDEKCSAQGVGNGNIKFQAFAEQWFKEYAEPNLRPRTVARLHQLEERTYQAIGHIRLDKLTARHIQRFIDNLGEDGISTKRDLAKPKADLSAILKGRTQKDLAETSGVSRSTISSMCRGEGVTLTTAEKISTTLGKATKELFTIQKGSGKLAPKSIQHYLSFVSSVLDYAFRFEIISSNPCKRVVIPAGEAPERDCYTVEEAQTFLERLDHAPIKYRAFFVLAIYGGFRRGELLGLEWQDIDFQSHVVKVQRTSQYLAGRGTFTDDTKTEKSHRALKLPAPVFNVLRQLRAEQAHDRLRMEDQWLTSGRL